MSAMIMDRATGEMVCRSLINGEGNAKFAAAAGNFLRIRMRETSVSDQILTPQPVPPQDLVPGYNLGSSVVIPGRRTDPAGDTVQVIRSVEKEGTAMLMDFRGEPRAVYVDGDRFAIPFGKVSTMLYEKNAAELLANNYDILGIIAKTAFFETHTQRDKKFLSYCDMAVGASGHSLTASGPIQRSAFRAITHPALRNQIPPMTILMSKVCFQDLSIWDMSDMGSSVDEVTQFGYMKKRINNLTFICSIKTDLFDTWDGNRLASSKIYCFPEEKYLGYSYYIGEYNVWSQWVADLWQYQAWQLFGLGIGNIRGITRMTINHLE